MGLTTEVLHKLEAKGFDELFKKEKAHWTKLAEKARVLMAEQIPGGHVKLDDVRKVLIPMLELDVKLEKFLYDREKPITPKHWILDFADYVIDRVYGSALQKKE